ncbi:MAG: hypothetical protein QNJ12_00525 [Ilumatobacter sp.]|uniref:hypothetical protein n=1 Tax=Ilumatobacter sp. TaxID=1967498 RepID=UPI00260AC3B6|nr:hypothetical protein [Ilumatobacter sp.]MDJ0767236.1 hypothetical protein [Ilumatobacter sp.]
MSDLGADAFDFWLGEWDCVFDGGHAVNTITRGFDGKVLTERFEMDTPRRWSGTSHSVYQAELDLWRQTWVDCDGSYWHFVGSLVDGQPSFGTPERVDRDETFKRMVFTDIAPDSFHWRWESSPDGETWTVNWEIDYARRPGTA